MKTTHEQNYNPITQEYEPTATAKHKNRIPKHCLQLLTPLWRLLYAIPACDALKEAADVTMSLYSSKKSSLPTLIGTGFAAFISTTTLTAETVRENLNESLSILVNAKLPEEWNKLSKPREIVAILFTIIAAGFSAPSEAMQTYYFINPIPDEYRFVTIPLGWMILSGLIAVGAGATTLLTETIEAYHAFRWLLSDEKISYSNKLSRIFSPTFGGLLGLLKAIQDAVQGFVAIKTIFNINSITGKYLLGIASLLDIFPNFCFSGVLNIKALDNFFAYLAERKVEPKKIISFLLALSLSLAIANLKRPLNIDFYNDLATYYNFSDQPLADPAFAAFSSAIVLQEAINTTAALYTPIFRAFNLSCETTHSIYQYVILALHNLKKKMADYRKNNSRFVEEKSLLNEQEDIEAVNNSSTLKKNVYKKNTSLLFRNEAKPAIKPKRIQCGII